MSLKINYNVSAMIANNSLKQNDSNLSTALERLSSGYKINNAKDNPAGLAIARRMNAQIRGLSVAEQDAEDGESVVEIADGALAEVHDMLQRMNELAVKASTGTVTDEDRAIINDEVDGLKEEIVRIGQTTEFNGQKLFDGSFDLKGYSSDNDVKVNYYSDDVSYGKYEVAITLTYNADNSISEGSTATIKDSKGVEQTLAVSGNSNQLILSGEKGYEIRLGMRNDISEGIEDNTQTSINVNLDLTGIGAMTLQVGANEGQVIDIRIPELSLQNAGIDDMNVLSKANAEKAIDQIDNAVKYVSEMRSRMGAYQNRLQHTESNLSTAGENMTAAYSRIMDTDMATEMTNYTSLQVVSQAATSILAQANERPSQMLQLLQ